jgi:RNA polymerase sigma factor (sigma-70 family)
MSIPGETAMATGSMHPLKQIVRHVRHAALTHAPTVVADGRLLDSFLACGDESAFAMLVERHGPMVLGVCRRVIGDLHDAEDAFQAVFLVLARKANSIVPRDLVGNWLHGVAYRTALQARDRARRRHARERQVKDMPQPSVSPDIDLQELLRTLDHELTSLPEKYRVAIVLCDLEGRSRRDVARQLKVPEGTLSSRLAKGRQILARRLTRHGAVFSGAALASVLAEHAVSAAIQPALVVSTAQAAALALAGQSAAGLASAEAVALSQGVLKTMFLNKLKASVVFVGVILGGVGIGFVGLPGGTNSPTAHAGLAGGPVVQADQAPPTGKLTELLAVAKTPDRVEQGQKEEAKVPALFANRKGAKREQVLREHGGSPETEAAVARGLKWLSLQQQKDGRWKINGQREYDAGATALALLPMLASDHTHKPAARNPYDKTIDRGLQFLIRTQNADTGYFGGNMYVHGLATMAICEAYGLSQDPALKKPAQAAVNLIVKAQHQGGGWRYTPAPEAGDLSIFGWQVMALKTAQAAGLDVPDAAFKNAKIFLDSCCQPGEGYSYTPTSPSTNRLTAVGLMSRQHLEGWGPKNQRMIAAVDAFITTNPPDHHDAYYTYYASNVMFQLGGKSWREWNEKMRAFLLQNQDKNDKGENFGSWSPERDPFGPGGGRLMVTSLNLLTLQVYYRHAPLPTRERDAEESKKK